MKKFTKKLISTILLLGLIFTSFSPRVAKAAAPATGEGKITVDNPKDGETYTLYRVFDLIMAPDVEGLASTADTTYLYTAVNKKLEASIVDNYSQLNSGRKSGGKMVINATPLTDGTINPYDFSNWLSGLPANNFEKIEGDKEAGNGAVEWSGLPLGYYMVKSTQGTLVSLNTTDKEVNIHEKNPDSAKINLTKEVKGGSASNSTSGPIYANIGEDLEYKITFNVHAYANKDYVLEDVIPKGITLTSTEPVVELQGEADPIQPNGAYPYTVNSSFVEDQATNTKNLKITFPKATIQSIAKTLRSNDPNVADNVENNTSAYETSFKTITITYNAKLNNDAVMSNHVKPLNNNKNIAKLTYDEIKYKPDPENPGQQIIKSGQLSAEVDVRTTDFQIKKFAKDIDNLEGAKFKIYDKETEGNEIKVTKSTNTNYFVNPGANSGSEIVSTNTENVVIKGLKPGTYWIEETTAPTGYNKIQDRMKLVIEEDTDKIKYTATIEGKEIELTDGDPVKPSNIIKIENQTGAELPETGGMGRTLIYTIGGVLFFGALVLLIARKKTKEDRA